jgi:hypothetical protein
VVIESVLVEERCRVRNEFGGLIAERGKLDGFLADVIAAVPGYGSLDRPQCVGLTDLPGIGCIDRLTRFTDRRLICFPHTPFLIALSLSLSLSLSL